jgi:hypothetical protein
LAGQRSELFYIIPFLAIVIGLKLALALWVWRRGFLEYDADGFTRSVSAWQLHTGQKQLQIDAWLPLQFWVNGWLMNFWPDLLHVPRLVNMLCSIGTTINFFFIGRSLFGRWNGYATALLAAIFPWEIWFGLSGMSESMTNFFLTLGLVFLCQWLRNERASAGWLVGASLGFLGATMLRYEAWFYSAVYALIVLYVAWRRGSLKQRGWLKILPALALTFSFMLLWMLFSWLDPRLHSPLGFAKLTSELNARIYGAENSSTGFLERLVYYPQIFWGLLYQLSLPAIAGSLWLAFRPVSFIRPYLALVWGEFGLFILTTLPYNNIAPGSARYPVSNLLLLLPVVVYLLQWLFEKAQPALRWGAVVLFVALAISQIFVTLDRAPNFPDGATRQAANWLRNLWQEGYLQPDERVIMHLPAADGPKGADYTRVFYSLQVLTNHPDQLDNKDQKNVITDSDIFGRLTQDEQGYAPHVWLHLNSAGGAVNYFTRNYREVVNFGDYWLARMPLFRSGVATPQSGPLGQTFEFKADEYDVNERTAEWISGPNGAIIDLGNKRADEHGIITLDYTAKDMAKGEWSVTIVGQETRRRAIVRFFIT